MPEDTLGCCLVGTTGMILGGLVGAGVNAGYGALSGVVGAAILNASGYKDYLVPEATRMGALGNCILGAAAGAIVGAGAGVAAGVGFFSKNNDKDDDKKKSNGFLSTAITHVGFQTIGGVLGWA